MSNFDENTYFAGAALTNVLSATGNDSLSKYSALIELSGIANDIASVQNNDKYPQDVKDMISGAIVMYYVLGGSVLPYDILFHIESSYEIALGIPENLMLSGEPNLDLVRRLLSNAERRIRRRPLSFRREWTS